MMANPADDIISIYRRHAKAWAEARAPHVVEAKWLDRFTALLDPGVEILDLGCGPGVPIARYLTDGGYALHGVDASPEMLTLFRANIPAAPATLADMRELHLGRTFAGILAWDSFFHLTPDDQRRMFAIFRAHSRPGSALMFTSGPAFGESLGTLEGDVLYHASLDADEYRHLLDANGFAVVDHVDDDPDCGGHTIWLARRT